MKQIEINSPNSSLKKDMENSYENIHVEIKLKGLIIGCCAEAPFHVNILTFFQHPFKWASFLRQFK